MDPAHSFFIIILLVSASAPYICMSLALVESHSSVMKLCTVSQSLDELLYGARGSDTTNLNLDLKSESVWRQFEMFMSVWFPAGGADPDRPAVKQGSGQSKYRHRCSVCNREFSRPSRLADHMAAHSGDKPHSCSVCGKRFSKKINVTVHQRVHYRREAVLLSGLRGQLRPAGLPAAAPARPRRREAPPVLGMRARIRSAATSCTTRADAHGREAVLLSAVSQALCLSDRAQRAPENPQRGEPALLLLLREGLLHPVVLQGSREAPHGTEAPPLLVVPQELQPAGAAEETPAETRRGRRCARSCEEGESGFDHLNGDRTLTL